jgi:hypothetical protein
MKKKLFWLVALFTALALTFTACPGGGDDNPNPDTTDEVEFWLASDNQGTKLSTLSTTVTGTASTAEDPVIYVFFTPLGKTFDKVKINFTMDPGTNISWQCAYDANGTWGQNGNDYIDWLEAGPIEVNPATMFPSGWGEIAGGATTLNKTSMKGICLRLSPEEGDGITFTLTDVSFTGAGSGTPTPPPNNEGPIIIYDSGFKTGASFKNSSSFVTEATGKINVGWNPNDATENGVDKGAFRVEVQLTGDLRANLTNYTKFKMSWTCGTVSESSFNISLFFSSSRMLNKTVPSGAAEFNIVTDNPSWAAGWGDAAVGTITGFEIYADDTSKFGTGDTLVISSISFE